MLVPKARGELSEALFRSLRQDSADNLLDIRPTDRDDLQIALWSMYELHYSGFEDVDEELEWEPRILELRRSLERSFERELR